MAMLFRVLGLNGNKKSGGCMTSGYRNHVTVKGAALGVSMLALACALPAHAQTTDAAESTEVLVTGTRATTATKTDTPILRVPQAIEVVTTEDVLERGGQSIREALQYTAGVSSATGGDDSRGDFNSVRGHESVLYVDGLKRNYGFVFMPRVDINTLERVEVLIGPASQLYGSGSAGGVTNMQTKRPQFEFGGSASISYGTFDRKEGVIDVTGPLGDTVAARFVGVLRDSNSRMDYTPNDRQLVQGAITWKPTARTDITAIGIHQHDKNPPNYNIVPLVNSLYARGGTTNRDRFVPDSRFFGEPTINKGDKEYTALSLLASHDFSDSLSFRSSNRYTWANTEQAEYYLATYYGTGPLDPFIAPGSTRVPRNLYAISVKYNVFNTDNSLAFKFDTGSIRHQLLAGIDYSYFKNAYRQVFVAFADSIDVFNPVYGTAPAPVFGGTTTEVLKQTGFYAQDQIDFGEVASLVVGLRHDRYTRNETGKPQEATNRTTKRAGLTVNVTPTLAPYVSYAESFLPIVGQNQLGQTYQPLSGKQKEIGVKWQPLPSTMLRVSLYDLEENNALRTDPVNPFLQTQTGFKKSRGVEFQASHNLRDDLSLVAAFSYATAKLSGENYQADGIPQYMASIFGTKTVELTSDVSLRLGGGVRYQGKQTSRNGTFIVEAPSFTLVDALAAFDYKNWTLQFNAINLLDDRYYPGCSAFGSCANGEPRTVQGSLSFRF